MTTRPLLSAGASLADRLGRLKENGNHLGNTGKGMMIDDPVTLEILAELGEREGKPRREIVVEALTAMLCRPMEMFDVVELVEPLEGLRVGSRGTVVTLHDDACEVEFAATADNSTRTVRFPSLQLVAKHSPADA